MRGYAGMLPAPPAAAGVSVLWQCLLGSPGLAAGRYSGITSASVSDPASVRQTNGVGPE